MWTNKYTSQRRIPILHSLMISVDLDMCMLHKSEALEKFMEFKMKYIINLAKVLKHFDQIEEENT